MTVGELKAFIENLDDDTPVVTPAYNYGNGGMFDADASVRTVKGREGVEGYEEDESSDGVKVLRISNYW